MRAAPRRAAALVALVCSAMGSTGAAVARTGAPSCGVARVVVGVLLAAECAAWLPRRPPAALATTDDSKRQATAPTGAASSRARRARTARRACLI